MRKFIKRGAIAAAVLAGAVYTSSFFVRSEIERGSGAYLSAAQLDSLAGLLGDSITIFGIGPVQSLWHGNLIIDELWFSSGKSGV